MTLGLTLDEFCQQWNCTPRERASLVVYLAVIRLQNQVNSIVLLLATQNQIDK